jgi:hypothetical protein
MTRRLLIACGFLIVAMTPVWAQDIAPPASTPAPPQTAPVQGPPPPAARLIRRRAEPRPVVRLRAGPVDERCRGAKQELDLALKRPASPRKTFEAQKAYNAGTRLCREGQAEKGMAKFREGLSNLQ